ncbi:hypothetical protein L6Q96_10880 [Candidatus Binatia bacterium]|nr:hypothetical protein [Candidatus Binatia bacterium]
MGRPRGGEDDAGARLSEILTLMWEHVDFEGRGLNLPDSKSGAKTIHLNAPALQILAGLPRESEWVLPGRYGKKPYVNVKDPWQRLRTAAELLSSA